MGNQKQQSATVPSGLFTVSVCTLIIIFLCSIWTFYCMYGSDYELSDRSASYGLFTMLLFLVTSAVVSVAWMLVAILAAIAIIICIYNHKKYKKPLQKAVIVKHIFLTTLSVLPYLFLTLS